MIKKILALCLAIVLPVFADVGDWKTFTDMSHVRDLVISSNEIWSATGGGVLKFDVVTQSFQKFTNTEGLSSNDVTTLVMDKDGGFWFGLANGRINRLDPQTWTWEVIDDFKGHMINDFFLCGDTLFVGLDIGVSVYIISRREVKETYKNLGSFQVEIPVYTVFINGEDIWVGTDEGIAKSSLRFLNLLDPQSWVNYTTRDGLPSNTIRAFAALDSVVFAGTGRGVARFWGNRWEVLESGLGPLPINDLLVAEGKLYTATEMGVFKLEPNNTWNRVGDQISDVTCVNLDPQGNLWVGREDQGLAYLLEDGSWKGFIPDGPGSNSFKDLTVDEDGILWCATSKGFHGFDGTKWVNYTKEKGLASDDIRVVIVGPNNSKWFGSWGGGVIILDEEGLHFYNSSDGHLVGIPGDPNYVVVNDMTLDQYGTVWMLNYQALNGNALVALTPDSQWVYFSTIDGLRSTTVTALAIDQWGRVWVGTLENGICVLDYGTDLFDKSDDDFSQGLTITDGLVSNNITAIAVDHNGVVWIGTPKGVNYWKGGEVYSKSGLISDEVRCIAVDPRNNKWFGTSGGVSVLDAEGYHWTHYTTANSPLVSDNVTCIAFNPKSGEAFIGTAWGLSRLETPFAIPKQDLSQVKIYPNPFLISPGKNNRLIIDNLADNSTLRIYTPSGFLVREIPSSHILGPRAYWDGRNDRDEMVASGIYVVLIFTDQGGVRVGRVAVIRE